MQARYNSAVETSNLPKKIGLLSDSHGDLEALEAAVQLLLLRGAASLIHLGDICDSLRLDLLDASVRLIHRHGIRAVKGNNDFLLENLLLGRPPETADGTEPLIRFLQGLPMKIVWGEVCFAHSLPFDFLRAFYEPIDIGTNQRAEEVFGLTPYRILFCGHSHQPVVFRLSGKNVERAPFPATPTLQLDRGDRHIVVTGAVSEGECVLFDAENWRLERIRIP